MNNDIFNISKDANVNYLATICRNEKLSRIKEWNNAIKYSLLWSC